MFQKHITLLAAAAMVSVIPATGMAATLEEVMVTAQRRAENLQEVPVAITALSAETIEKADVHDLSTLAHKVPGLTFSPFSPGQNIVSLRGAASNDDGAGTDNSVAMFVDDVYLGRASNINPELFDVERIEVLRGPQGTLYGRNTIGGAINIVSIKPDLESFSGKAKLTLGNYARSDLSAYVNGPFSDNLAGKLSFSYRKRDGWVDNLSLNKKQKNDNTLAVRGQLLWQQGDAFEALFSADFATLDVDGMARIPVDTGYYQVRGLDDRLDTTPEDDAGDVSDPASFFGSYATVCTPPSTDCAAGTVDGYAKRDAQGVSARLSWNLDAGELISITAYRTGEADWNMESVGAPALFLIDDILDETDQLSQEFRWVASVGDDIDYVAGFWYLSEETDRTECFDLNMGSDCTPNADGTSGTTATDDAGGQPYNTDWYQQINETTSYALFGQVDWQLAEQWKLALGARYSSDKKDIQNFARSGPFVIINQTFDNRQSETWSAFTPKIALTYTADDWSVYGLVSQGFKSGGFPAGPQNVTGTLSLRQEEAMNVELGFKADIADALRLNVALFQTDYTDLQIQSFGPVPGELNFGQFRSFNAGDAEVFGIEIEATWAVTENLSLSGYYGFQDSELVDVFVPNAGFPNQSGQDMIRTPENKFDINLEYILPLAGGSELAFDLGWHHTASQRGELEPYAVQTAFHLLNASVAWTGGDDKLKVALWGRNLADDEYIQHLFTVSSNVVAVFGDPLMAGVSATYRF